MPSRYRINSRRQGTANPKARRPKVALPERKKDGRMPKPDQVSVDRLVAYHETRLGREICGAWKPVKGDVCCQWPMRGGTRCQDDGGLSKRGIDSARFTVGIFSDVIKKTPVAETYHRILNDTRLMDLREHVGFATSVLFQIVEELYAGTPPIELWQEAQRLKKAILANSDNQERATQYIYQLLELIDEGADAAAKRAEVREQQDHIRKLNTTERRHLEKERELMSMEAFVVNLAILSEGMKMFFKAEEIRRFRNYMQANIVGLPGGKTALVGTELNPN